MAKSAGGLASRRLLIGVAVATAFALLFFDAHVAVGQGRALPESRHGFTSKGVDRIPPSKPTDLAVASVLGDRLLLSWDASTDNVGVAGYDVFRNGVRMTTVTTTSASRTGRLSCGRSYAYGVRARDLAGNASKRGRLRISTSACAAGPAARPYFVVDYSNGALGAPWTTSFSASAPGFTDLTQSGPTTGTTDGRVKVVPSPSGPGYAARFELRDSDPGWPSNPDVQKAEVRTDPGPTFNKSGVSVGDVRWFSTRIYLPYNAAEKFEWAHGGSQPYTALWGLHPSSSTGWGAIDLGWEAWQLNAGDKNMWLNFFVEGGTFPENTYSEIVNLVQLTDRSGNRIMGNYNRWIDLVWGIKFAPDNTGWLEAWVDGVNVYPRKNRPTMWAGDSGLYFKYGLYKRKDASFPDGGRSVIYFGRTTIGLTKP
jgi:Polysaccharide lyase